MNSEKLKQYVMSISFKERKAKELAHYKQRVSELKKMEIDEIDLEYINLKLEYEHKKNALTIFIIFIAIACLINVWKYSYMFMEKAIQYAILYEGSGSEVVKVAFAISLSITVFIILVIFAILIMHTRRLRQVHKNLMIVNEVRKTIMLLESID